MVCDASSTMRVQSSGVRVRFISFLDIYNLKHINRKSFVAEAEPAHQGTESTGDNHAYFGSDECTLIIGWSDEAAEAPEEVENAEDCAQVDRGEGKEGGEQ